MPRGQRDEYKRRLESAIGACDLIAEQTAWILEHAIISDKDRTGSWIRYANVRANTVRGLLVRVHEIVAGE